MVRVEYDPKADAMYIWFRKAKYEISEELAENVVNRPRRERTHHRNRDIGCVKESRKGAGR